MYVFVSHSSIDAAVAQRVCACLEERGNECFLAPRDIRSGYVYAEEIVMGIDRSDAMVVLLSQAANDSPHVLREIERAVSKNIPIIVYQLEKVQLSKSMEYFLLTHQWINAASEKDEQEIADCVEALEKKAVSALDSFANGSMPENSLAGACEKATTGKTSKKFVIAAAVAVLALAVIVVGLWCVGGIGKRQEKETSGGETGESQGQTEALETQTQENTKAQEAITVQLGDRILFGTYQDAPIEWRVLKLSEDGKQAVLVASHILTMKAFDAAESGTYNQYEGTDYWMVDMAENPELQPQVRGNSDWSVSNLRTWLNSNQEMVLYADQAPVGSAMSEFVNGYDTEPGFLYGFTEEEQSAIVETEVVTEGNALTEGEVTTYDKVILLSREELVWFAQANMSFLAVPTEEAIAQDQSNWYQYYSLDYHVAEYSWWLRDAVEDSACKGYVTSNSNETEQSYIEKEVGLEGFGVRPAITVDLTCSCIQVLEEE